MIWDSWNDFFAMGGYARYVWGSTGVVFAALGAEMLLAGQRRHAALAAVRAMARRSGGGR
jgi:heme exporter protein D